MRKITNVQIFQFYRSLPMNILVILLKKKDLIPNIYIFPHCGCFVNFCGGGVTARMGTEWAPLILCEHTAFEHNTSLRTVAWGCCRLILTRG